MENIKEIRVDMPRLDEHDNHLVISVYLKEPIEVKGEMVSGFILGDSTSRECDRTLVNLLKVMFEREFVELQEKYKKLIRKTIEEIFYDAKDLEEYSSNLLIIKRG